MNRDGGFQWHLQRPGGGLCLIIVETGPLETCSEGFEAVFPDWQERWQVLSFSPYVLGCLLGLFNSDAI